MAKTRHGQKGIGVRPYLGFSPKKPASGPKADGQVTRLTSIGIGGRRRLSGKGTGPFTRLTSMAINGRRVSFQPKTPAIPPEEDVVTRLLPFGIGGKRVSFIAKTPSVVEDELGGAGKRTRVKKKRKLTTEEIRGLEVAYGLGLVEEITQDVVVEGEIIKEISPELAESKGILITESLAGLVLEDIAELPEIPEVLESQDIEQLDDDILLILAIAEATNSL